MRPLLHPEYGNKAMTRVVANSNEELAAKLEGTNASDFLCTVRDGRRTDNINPPKSNWANTIDTPPFETYHVTSGITFTFGGLRINCETGQVMNMHRHLIPGQYTAREMVSRIFYFNYSEDTGLVSSTVLGRIAGLGAAVTGKAGTGQRAATPMTPTKIHNLQQINAKESLSLNWNARGGGQMLFVFLGIQYRKVTVDSRYHNWFTELRTM